MATDDPLTPVLVTFGIAVVLRNLMVELFGADPRALDGGALATAGFEIGGLRIGWYPVLVLGLAVLAFGALQWLLRHSRFGLIVRATSDHREIVRTMGVRPRHVYGVVMGLSLAFASVAGLLLALRSSFTPFSGVERLLGAFEVVIIGGMGSFWGALAGGIALGVAQLAGQRLDSNAGALYAHLLFFSVLMVAPERHRGPTGLTSDAQPPSSSSIGFCGGPRHRLRTHGGRCRPAAPAERGARRAGHGPDVEPAGRLPPAGVDGAPEPSSASAPTWCSWSPTGSASRPTGLRRWPQWARRCWRPRWRR